MKFFSNFMPRAASCFLAVWSALACEVPLLNAQTPQPPLTTLDYRVSGSRLNISPAALAVPKNIAGSVATSLAGAVPEGSYVEAMLRGPSFPARRLVGAPGQPLLLPPLSLSGDYSLDGIRLVEGPTGKTLLDAVPSSVPVQVFDEVLVSRVTSRPLSLSEIQEKGIVIDEENFRAVEFEVGFVLDGQVFPVKFPVVTPQFRQTTEIIPAAELEERLAEVQRINDELSDGVRLPPELETVRPNVQIRGINVQLTPGFSENLALRIPPIPALMVIPGNIGYLNQFFSVRIFTENAAPKASGLSVHSIRAELVLPPGPDRVRGTFAAPGDDPVRFARIGANAEIRPVVEVRAAGADGEPATPDDVDRLLPGQAGQGEFLVEGLQEGLHVLDLVLSAKLDGLAAGTVEVEGRAAGSVQVSNPSFSLAFSHPRTVRAGEPYDAFVTLLNTSQAIANLPSISLNKLNVSGSQLLSDERVEFTTLKPGETVTAKFRFLAQRTGSISFSNLTTSDDSLVGRFRLTTGVDERGVSLSSNTLVLPEYVNELPPEVVAAANRVLGQALSSATAPQLPAGVTRVPRSFISTGQVMSEGGKPINSGGGSVILQLAEAGQRVRYGEPLSRVLPDLLLDWQGGRQFSEGWDQIIRSTDAGREWRESLMRAMEEADPAPDDPVSRLVTRAPDLAGRGEKWLFAAVSSGVFQSGGGGAELTLRQGPLTADTNTSAIAKAAGYGGREGAWLASATPGVAHWKFDTARPGITTLSVLQIGADGKAKELLWRLTDVVAGQCATHDATGGSLTLDVDDTCDGVPERSLAATVTDFTEITPAALTVRQDPALLVARPQKPCFTPVTQNDRGETKAIQNYGNILAVLFNKPMTQESAGLASAYTLDDGTEAAFAQVQPGGRVALLTLRRPVGALVPHSLSIGAGVTDLRGNAFAAASVPVASRLVEGLSVRGRILRSDGSGGANLPVTLTMNDGQATLHGCAPHDQRVAQVFSNEEGYFAFEFVLSGIPFSLSTTDIGALRDNEAIAVILESSRDGAVTAERLRSLGASVAGSEESANEALRRAFGVANFSEAIALAEGLDRAVVRDFPPQSRQGGEGVYVLRFRGRGTVGGTVLAADGLTPLPGVAVNLFPDPASRELGRGLFSDADGRFAFLGVPLGSVSVEAMSPQGHARTVSALLENAGQVLELPIALGAAVAPLTTLQGRVTEPDGTPHSGAAVFVRSQPNEGVQGPTLAQTVSDEGGFWTAANVQAGRVRVIAISRDGRRGGERTDIAAVAGAVNTVNVTLQARATVRGRVEFANGDPVPGAVVGGGEALVTTDALGAFTLEGVPTGSASVSAGLEAVAQSTDPRRRFSRLGSTRITVLPGDDNFAVIRFAAAGRIAGQVLDAAGRFVPNVNVAIPLDIDETQGSFLWVKADAGGLFSFDNLGLDNYDLSAPAPPVEEFDADKAISQIQSGDRDQVEAAIKASFAAFTGASNPFLNGEGETFNPADWGFVKDVRLGFDGETVITPVRFLPKASLSGIVKNGQGVPVGAKVRLTGVGPKPNGAPTMRIKADLDSDAALGTFSFPNGTFIGDWGLQAASPFFPVVISAGGRTTQVDPVVENVLLQFPAVSETNGSLSGQVLLPDGSAAGGDLRVHISFSDDFFLRTDEDGRFATTAGTFTLPARGYTVTVLDEASGATGQAGANVTAGQDNKVTVRLLGRGEASVLVRHADGTPASGAAVEINLGGFPGGRFQATADGAGAVRFSNVFEGGYAAAANAVLAGSSVAGRASLTVPAGGIGEAVIFLGGVGSVRGQFVRTDGVTPVPFANASLGGLAVAPTDADGRFVLEGVPLGTHRLTVTDAVTGRSGAVSVSLTAPNQTINILVVETALGSIFGLVTNGTGSGPVGNAEVELRLDDPFANPRVRTVTTGPDGGYSFAGVPSGTFHISVIDPVSGLAGAVNAAMPQGGGDIEINLPLQATASVLVHVVEPDGVTPASATVRMPVGSRTFSADTDAEGRVRFENVRVLTGAQLPYTVGASSRVLGQTRSSGTASFHPRTRGAEETLTVVLRGVGSVAGQVRLADGVTPAPGAEVRMSLTGGENETVIATAGGDFTFNNVPIGGVTLAAFSLTQGAQASATLTVPGATVTQNLTLTASGTVAGRVLRADGVTPVDGADVVVNFTSQSSATGIIAAVTGADGRFSASPVTVGTFTVSVTRPTVNGIARRGGTLSANGETADVGDLVLDESPPTVLSSIPAPGSDGVDINAPVELLFSEALDPASIFPSGLYVRPALGGPSVPAVVTLVAPAGETALRRVVITPSAPLASETAYQLIAVDGDLLNATGQIIAKGPRDNVGRALPVLYSASFVTRDQRAPALLSFTPENGAEQVDVRTPLRLSFDETIAPGATITLTGPGGAVPGAVSLGVNGLVLNFLPAANLPPNAVFTASVSGVADLAGNAVAGQPLTRSFATLDTLGPVLSALRIKGGAAPVTGSSIVLEAVPAAPEAGISYRLTANAANVGTSALDVLEIPFVLPVSGAVVFRAVAIDRFGNEGPLTELSVNVQANQPPVLAFERLSPATGPVPSGSAFSVRVSATDDGGVADLRAAATGAAAVPLIVSTGASVLIQGTVPPAAEPGSTIQLIANATDNSGVSGDQQTLTLTISDGTPPLPAVAAPAPDSIAPRGAFTLEVDWSDNSGAASLQVTLTGAAAASQSRAVTGPPNAVRRENFVFDLSEADVAGGAFTATVTAADGAGNSSAVSRSFALPDSVPPTLLSVTPAAGAARVNLWTRQLTLTFDEPLGAVANDPALYELTGPGGTVPVFGVTRSGNALNLLLWPLTTAGGAPGEPLLPGAAYNVRVPASLADASGNPWRDTAGAAVPPEGILFTFTTAAVLDLKPEAGTKIVPGQTVTFEFVREAGLGADLVFYGFAGAEPSVKGGQNSFTAPITLPADATEARLLVSARNTLVSGHLSHLGRFGETPLDLRPRGDDDDGDAWLNGFEADRGMNPFAADEDAADFDSDGFPNGQERLAGTDPGKPDTDDDGLNDGAEFTANSNPLNPDSDGDGIRDGSDRRPLTVNAAPSPQPDTVPVEPGQLTTFDELDFLANDTDPDGDTLRVDAAFTPVVSNGAVSYVAAARTFSYTPADGFTGTDTLTYRVVDEGGLTAIATATLIVGTVDPPTDVPTAGTLVSVAGRALRFDGVNDRALANGFTMGTAWTVEAWVRVPEVPAVGRQSIAGVFHNDNRDWGLELIDGTFRTGFRNRQTLDSGVAPEPGRWYHVAGGSDGALIRIYVDGVLKNTGPLGATYTPGAANIVLGSAGFTNTAFFKGDIDEVRAWSRALDDAELKRRFQHLTGGREDGLLLDLRLDEEFGNRLTDSGPLNQSGSLSTFPSGSTPARIADGPALQQWRQNASAAFRGGPVTLAGADPENDPISFTVLSLPSAGRIFQMESDAQGAAITTVPAVVTDPAGRIFFLPDPADFAPRSLIFLTTAGGETSEQAELTIRVLDPAPPRMVFAGLSSSGTETSPWAGFRVEFNEAMDRTTLTSDQFSLRSADGSVVPVTLSPNFDGISTEIRPVSRLDLGVTYTFTVGRVITDASGHPWIQADGSPAPAGGFSMSITTGARPVATFTPPDRFVPGQSVGVSVPTAAGFGSFFFQAVDGNGQVVGSGGSDGITPGLLSGAVQTRADLVSDLTLTVKLFGSLPGTVDLPSVVLTLRGRGENDDGDLWNNGQEADQGTDPFAADEAGADPDADGLTNADELAAGTHPLRADSDFDGLTDTEELADGLNPLLSDTDSDGRGDGNDPRPLLANVAPSGGDDTLQIPAGAGELFILQSDLMANDSDADGDGFFFNDRGNPAHGRLEFTNFSGILHYAPDETFTGSDAFTYTISDGILSSTVTVNISTGPNHPPVPGAPALRTSRFLVFDGDDQALLPGALLNGATDATIEFWLNIENSSGFTVLSGRSAADVETLEIRLSLGGEGGASVFGTWGSTFFGLDFPGISLHGRLHCALVRDAAAGLLTLYVDGVPGESMPFSDGPLEIAPDRLAMGRAWADGGTFSDFSRIDGLGELKIWRRARGAAEIAASFPLPQSLPAAGLAGYFRFNESAGTALVNDAAPGEDGALAADPNDPERGRRGFVLPDAFVRGTEDEPLLLTLPATDADGDAFRITLTDSNSVTVFAAVPDGLGGFVPASESLSLPAALPVTGGAARVFVVGGEPGSAALTYFAHDAVSTSMPGLAVALLAPAPDTPSAPLGNDDFFSTLAGTAVPLDLLGNDFDPDGTPREELRYVNVTQPDRGVLVAPADGFSPLTYTPGQDDSGSVTFTYQVSDGALTSPPVTVHIQVTASRRFRWIAAAGGSWNDPAHWDRGAQPGQDDTAIIDLPGTYTVTVDQPVSIARLEMGVAGGSSVLDVLTTFSANRGGTVTGGALVRIDAPSANLFLHGSDSAVARVLVRRGVLSGNGLDITEALAWKGGTIGSVNIQATCAVDLSTPFSGRAISGSFVNHSTLRFDDAQLIVGGTLRNAADGVMEVISPASVSRNTQTFPSLINDGILRVGENASINMDNFNSFSSTGTIELAGRISMPAFGDVRGRLIMAGGTLSQLRGIFFTPPVRFDEGTVVEGFGRISASVENSGLLIADSSRGDEFAFEGGLNMHNLVNTATGTLRLRLGTAYSNPNDTEPNDPFRDHVAIVTSAFTPGGGLEIELLPGFARASGESFAVIDYSSLVAGDFTDFAGLEDNFGYDFTRALSPGSLDLTVGTAGSVPGPAPGFAEETTAYRHWMAARAGTGRTANLLESDDADADGSPNLLEYAFGTDPFDSASLHQPVPILLPGQDGPRPALEFLTRLDTSSLRYVIHQSRDLNEWSPAPGVEEVSRVPVTGRPGLATVRVLLPAASGDSRARFFQVRVTSVETE